MTKPVNRPRRKPGRKRKLPPAQRIEVPRTTVPPELRHTARRIEALAASGHSVVGIARGLNTSKEVLSRWLDEHPALAEALARGRESERFDLHNYLYRTAMDPKVARKDRNFAAAYLLNNRHGYVSGDQSAEANRVSITFALPGAMSAEQFKVIEHEPTANALPVPAKRPAHP